MATDSKRELIVVQLVAALQAVTAGATYWNTFMTVDRKVRSITDVLPAEMPLLMMADETERKRFDSTAYTLSTLDIAIPFVRATPLGGATASRDGNRMIVDIERALLSFDGTEVSGTVVALTLTGNTKVLTELQVNDPPHDPVIVGEVRASLEFRTLLEDPGS